MQDEQKTGGRGLQSLLDQTCNRWRLKNKTIMFGRLPTLMGIVNATPDSFSDGGKFFDVDAAVHQALQLAADGAGILDIGGESTRPYSTPVTADEELRRVVPVIEKVSQLTDLPISIDTSKAMVARAALEAGAEIINDVTGLEGDADMIKVAVEFGAGVCAMHMQGSPENMQDNPHYENLIAEISGYLQSRQQHLLAAGISADRICLDPGIGFGKTHAHNLELVRDCHKFHTLKSPILAGHSRKGFIAKAIGNNEADRTSGTVAVTLSLAQQGIQVIRVHDVLANRHALQVFDSIGAIDGKYGLPS